MILRSRQHRGGMRWQCPMHNREPRQQWHADKNRWTSAASCRSGDDGHQQHQAHFKKHRHADHDAQPKQRPRQPTRTASIHQRCAQRGCTTRARQQTSKNCARPRMIAIWPMRLPTPLVKDNGTCVNGMPDTTPSPNAARAAPMQDARGTSQSTTAMSGQCPRRKPAGTSWVSAQPQSSPADYSIRTCQGMKPCAERLGRTGFVGERLHLVRFNTRPACAPLLP